MLYLKFHALVFGIILLISSAFSVALAQESSSTSILFPPPNQEQLILYDSDITLSQRDQWRIKGFGLRLAALHPQVWGYLNREHTNHRHLVPIKRYFLRASEDPHFEAKSIRASFHFKRTDKRYMDKMPHQKDPVFEIGFGGVFKEGSDNDKPLLDQSYVLRLSAFPRLPSGIFERRNEGFTTILLASTPLLEVGTSYDLELSFTQNEVNVTLNGEAFVRHAAPRISQGLLAVQTSWHPIILKTLSVQGLIGSGPDRKEVQFSGLIPQGPLP